MGKYFDRFPTTLYNNTPVKNIMTRVIIDDNNKKNFGAYLPYTMSEDNARPDLIASKYYDNSYYDWMIYISNTIIDPYYDIYKTETDLTNFIIKKYGSLQRAIDTVVFYRNNWIDNLDIVIPSSIYDGYNKALKKYYDPKINISNQVIGYTRKKIDWIVNTNKVRTIACNTEFFLTTDIEDVLVQKVNSVVVATGIVSAITDGFVTVEKITGNFVNTSGNQIYTKYSGIFSSATSITNPSSYFDDDGTLIEFDNIPESEAGFWSAVNAYEHEKEINEAKKELVLVKASQRANFEKQLVGNLK